MKDQYRIETSQIHAPADLIQKTKQAMEQEEQRLKAVEERKVGSDGTAITESEAITKKAKKNSFTQQIYKWTLPLTAAAAILILISVSLVMKSVKSDSSASDMMAESEYEKDMGMQLSEADIAEDYAMAEDVEDAAYPEEMENAESEAAEESETNAGYQDMEAKKDTAETADVMNGGEAYEQEQESELEITGVEEEPDFYDSPETESYLYRNLLFWLIQDNEGWTAYVSVQGDKYVISGAIADREEFVERAYGLLKEKNKNIK